MLFLVINKSASTYDQFGHAGVGMGDNPGQGGFGGGGIHMNMDDIFSQFGDILVEVLLKVFLVVAQEEADDAVKVVI